MPKKSSVSALPAEVKAWLDKALVEGNFSGYEALAKLVGERGYSISKSSLHRYGKEFEDTMAAAKIATEQAKAIAEACPDEAGTMNDALIRLVQQKSFEVLMKIQAEPGKMTLTSLGKMISGLAQSSVSVKKWMSEVKAKTQAAAETVKKISAQGGLSAESIKLIEAEILGITR
jgi:hypothetical protein